MSDSKEDRLSTEDLLRIEAICDRFEADLIAGDALPLEEYLQGGSPELEGPLRRELEKLDAQRKQYAEARNETLQDDSSVVGVEHTRLVHAHTAKWPQSAPVVLHDRFELIEQIGAGGNGTVWRARDCELERFVAVKIPHRDSVDDSGRFIREARSAAGLQHPNIVRVHEVGQQDGSCYLVTELIAGESLAELLKHRVLSLRESVELLLQVTKAIDYSHRMGVIHRDLKPQNILLDGERKPYVTDFGVAKNTNIDEATITQAGDLLGTPAYMAPEQARGASNEADERTDIYSLGVVLFKLLSGDVPFHGSIDSVVYQVIHMDAPSPRRWNRDTPRDLETICLKCLEKNPAKRFASAAELRDELERFQAGKPIRSRPVSFMQTAWKWMERNPRVAALSLSSFLLLLAVTAGSTVAALLLKQAYDAQYDLRVVADAARLQAIHARQEETKAKAEAIASQRGAEAEAEISKETVDFLESIFEESDPVALVFMGDVGAVPPTAEDLFTRAANRIRDEFKTRPRVRARLMDILGNACRSIGAYEEAERLLVEAAEIRNQNQAEYEPKAFRRESATNLFHLAWLKHDLSESEEAERLYQRSLQEAAEFGESADLLAADVQFHLGRLLLENRRNTDAEPILLASLQTRQRLLPADSRLITASKIGWETSRSSIHEPLTITRIAALLDGEDWASRLATDFTQMLLLRRQGNYDAACAAYRNVLEELRKHLGERRPIYLMALGDYTGLLWEDGNYREAYPLALQVIEAGRKLSPNHRHLRGALVKLATETLRAGRIEETDRYYREIQRMSDPDKFDFEVHHGLLWTSYASGRMDEALQHSLAMLEKRNQYGGEQSAWVHYAHARVLAKAERLDESRTYDERALNIATSIDRLKMSHPIWTERMSLIFSHNEEFVKAHEFAQHAFDLEEALRPADHPRIADRLVPLALTHARAGRTQQAITLLERAHEIRKLQLPKDDGRIKETQRHLTRVRSSLSRADP